MDLRAMDAHALRRAVALVDQEPSLLDRSVLQNVVLGSGVSLAAVPPGGVEGGDPEMERVRASGRVGA